MFIVCNIRRECRAEVSRECPIVMKTAVFSFVSKRTSLPVRVVTEQRMDDYTARMEIHSSVADGALSPDGNAATVSSVCIIITTNLGGLERRRRSRKDIGPRRSNFGYHRNYVAE